MIWGAPGISCVSIEASEHKVGRIKREANCLKRRGVLCYKISQKQITNENDFTRIILHSCISPFTYLHKENGKRSWSWVLQRWPNNLQCWFVHRICHNSQKRSRKTSILRKIGQQSTRSPGRVLRTHTDVW